MSGYNEGLAQRKRKYASFIPLGWAVRDAFESLPYTPSIVPEQPEGFRRMVAECLAHQCELAPREREFLCALAGWRGEPSPKQLAWLVSILDRLFGRAA